MNNQEIKLMQLVNQHLVTKTDKITAIIDLCGYQAQFYNYAKHSACIRTNTIIDNKTWGKDLVKTWGHRGTMHIFYEGDMSLFVRECKTVDKVCENGWYPFLVNQGIYISPERNRYFARLIVDAIEQGNGTRDYLKELCYKNGLTDSESRHVFNQWGGTIAELAGIGVITFKVQEKKEYVLCNSFMPLSPDDAFLEILRRYFTNFGPATLRDASYFTKKNQKEIKGRLSELPIQTFTSENKTYYYIDSMKNYNYNIPECIFLAGFDQLMLGYEKYSSIYLNFQHLRGIFNLNGLVFPALLLNGDVIGRWKEEKNKIKIIPFRFINANEKRIIERKCEEMWMNKKVQIIE